MPLFVSGIIGFVGAFSLLYTTIPLPTPTNIAVPVYAGTIQGTVIEQDRDAHTLLIYDESEAGTPQEHLLLSYDDNTTWTESKLTTEQQVVVTELRTSTSERSLNDMIVNIDIRLDTELKFLAENIRFITYTSL